MNKGEKKLTQAVAENETMTTTHDEDKRPQCKPSSRTAISTGKFIGNNTDIRIPINKESANIVLNDLIAHLKRLPPAELLKICKSIDTKIFSSKKTEEEDSCNQEMNT